MSQTTPMLNEATRTLIAERAYLIAESQGFAPGREEEFWMEAEREVLNGSAPIQASTPTEAEAPMEIVAIAKPRTRASRAKTAFSVEADGVSGIEIITPQAAPVADKPKRAPRTTKPKSA